MSIQQWLTSLMAAVLCALCAVFNAWGHDHRPARSEEALISNLSAAPASFRLDAETREIRIPFTIAPGARPEAVELVLNAHPASARSNGRIEAFVNRSRAVVLAPRAETFEARFALYSDDLRDGSNVLVLRLTGDVNDGWIINPGASRLRVSAAPADGFATLGEIETALRADYAAPRRIHIDVADGAGADELTVAALVAQGLALRMGEAPILVEDPAVAEITITAELAPGSPAIDLPSPSSIRLTANDASALVASARLFAARSMEGRDQRFDMTGALGAPRLDRPRVEARMQGGLSALALGGAPFGADQGGRAAIVISARDFEERAASLALVSRAALASGSAWLYAWYGTELSAAPERHDLLVLGAQGALDPRLMASAPPEVRAAASAAANRIPRERRFPGTTAFAADAGVRDARVTGIAARFDQADGRRVALFTAPEGADYARAAKRLARSSLWNGLEGSAALWDAAAVTPFGPSAAPRFSTEWLSARLREHDQWLALGAFSLAVFLLLLGQRVNRPSRRKP